MVSKHQSPAKKGSGSLGPSQQVHQQLELAESGNAFELYAAFSRRSREPHALDAEREAHVHVAGKQINTINTNT